MDMPAEVTRLASRLSRPTESTLPLSYRESAVLVILFPGADGPALLLTERPHSLSRHPEQVSWPGGGQEPGDAGLHATAMRETREELGCSVGHLSILGSLDLVDVGVSRYRITPFVAWSPLRLDLSPDPAEVASVLEVSLHTLLDPASRHQETWETRGESRQVALYRFGEYAVWGATARILGDLAQRLTEVVS
ncbi:MAG: NUDIX hydrolase [Chloroflexota bacterium]